MFNRRRCAESPPSSLNPWSGVLIAPNTPPHSCTLSILFSFMSASFWLVVRFHYVAEQELSIADDVPSILLQSLNHWSGELIIHGAPHIRFLSPSSSSPCPPPVGLLLRPIIPLALAADQGHGGIVFIFSVLQTIVHPHSPHAVRPFTSPLSTVLSTTNDFHLIVAFIAAS